MVSKKFLEIYEIGLGSFLEILAISIPIAIGAKLLSEIDFKFSRGIGGFLSYFSLDGIMSSDHLMWLFALTLFLLLFIPMKRYFEKRVRYYELDIVNKKIRQYFKEKIEK